MPQNTSTPARAARLRRGWTLRELASKCADNGVPVDHGSLARIERGQNVPRPRLRAVLADLLDLDAVTDFEKADEPADPQTPDDEVRIVRDGERAVQDDVPELSGASVERATVEREAS